MTKGSLTMRHLAVAVLVVVLVNTQLTWWIIFVLRENRTRLGFERKAIETECLLEVGRIGDELTAAHHVLDSALAADPELSNPPLPPFTGWRFEEGGGSCEESILEDGAVVFRVPNPKGCVHATMSLDWSQELLDLNEGMAITEGQEGDRREAKPATPMPPPFADWSISPTDEIWDEILDGYRSRILMMVSEGSFFAVMLFVLVALLWRTLRRELVLEQQHRNFLSAITHELKSPLAAMRLSLETILRGRADPSASARFLENALQDTERLQSLVEKVLEVTRYSRLGGSLDLQETCVSEVVEEALYRFSRRTTAAGADLSAEIEPDIWAEIDDEALSIVISNLLENALKYGGTIPRVDIGLKLGEGKAILTVTDNGYGIATDDVPMVFERFWRSGDEMTRTTEGTGLGLYLVRQIVKSHHGTVSVFDTGPEGTTFRVMLPGAKVMGEAT
ncbi:MAG: HAMP domain-containing histidine kinase [Thermoanaerobaculales bacterium]|nr:HAMP domain-containing histidine kinase [Thermoanaerobaculales bacterium]